jgi:hypothetical protein
VWWQEEPPYTSHFYLTRKGNNMLNKLKEFQPGKKTYTIFGLLLAVAVAGFFGLDLSPIADWVIPGASLPADVSEAVSTLLSNVIGAIAAVGVIMRYVTE